MTRAEAEVLIEIDAAAAERVDHGRFDDLFVKAIAHHVLASAGQPVPPRDGGARAADPAHRLGDSTGATMSTPKCWSGSRAMRAARKRNGPLMTLAAFLVGAAAASMAQTLAAVGDTLA